MYTQRWNIFSALRKVFFGVVLVLAYFLVLTEVQANESAENTSASSQQAQEDYSEKVKGLVQFLEGRSDSFVYNRVGRSDPFMPFIKEKVVTSDLEVPEQELMGMQKYEPGQLTLVAIVITENGPLAMVEDSVGKGYTIRNGTEIGRAGIVDSIANNTVVIKQRYKTSAGEERYKFVEMLLKKEGERQQ
jgi:type IV pilus assembly protein PilP